MSAPVRIIPRIDVRGENVVKGINLEGVRKVGKPNDLALKYASDGADELVFMDVVASLYGRNNILSVVQRAAQDIFIPLTVGGGIRSIEDITNVLRSGADKVAINTAAIENPGFLEKSSRLLGSQCLIASIEAKRSADGNWEAYTHNGREKTGLDAIEWAKKAEQLGVGEILITSVDQEGTMKGLDVDLLHAVARAVKIPVIGCGGVGGLDHVLTLFESVVLDAVCCASIFHFGKLPLPELKAGMTQAEIPVRL